MARFLVVEDNKVLSDAIKESLEEIIGKGNVDVAADYRTAMSYLKDNPYDLYLVDGRILPNPKSREAQPLGIKLMQEIIRKEGSPDKIRHMSTEEYSLSEARKLGIKSYAKGGRIKKYPDITKMSDELRRDFGAEK